MNGQENGLRHIRSPKNDYVRRLTGEWNTIEIYIEETNRRPGRLERLKRHVDPNNVQLTEVFLSARHVGIRVPYVRLIIRYLHVRVSEES